MRRNAQCRYFFVGARGRDRVRRGSTVSNRACQIRLLSWLTSQCDDLYSKWSLNLSLNLVRTFHHMNGEHDSPFAKLVLVPVAHKCPRSIHLIFP